MDWNTESQKLKKRKANMSMKKWGRWDELNPEILAQILIRVPAEQRVGNVALVCKSWMGCVCGPYCWTDIDIQDWCRRRYRTVDRVDSAVMKLVRRSKATFRRLSAFRLGDAAFAFLANCGRCLKVLQIPMSDITDKMVKKHAESLANVTVLDISYCSKITCIGLDALGKNCKSLVHLRRNMPLLERDLKLDDGEAMVIADTMPGLQHLQLAFGCFGDRGLDAILTKCKALTYLDIQGCRSVKLDGDLEDRCLQLDAFKSPWVHDYDDSFSDDEDDDEDFSSSDSD